MAEFIQKNPFGEGTLGTFVGLSGDEDVFGHKDFQNNLTVQGDLTVVGDTRVSQVVDFTSESGDISGFVFRGATGYFDEIVVGSIVGSSAGDSSGETSGGMDTGPIFVKNVNAVGGVEEILESEFGGQVIKKIKTAQAEIDVTILTERGDAQTFKPDIEYSISGNASSSVSVASSSLSDSSNGYSFDLVLRLDSSAPQTYLFKNGGRQTSLIIERDTLPVIAAAGFINQSTGTLYPSATFSAHAGSETVIQTEAKNGDTVKISITANKEIAKLVVLSSGALSSKTVNSPINIDNGDNTYTVETTATVGGAANSSASEGFSVKVEDSNGNESSTYVSDNQITTDNSSPSASVSLTYPGGQDSLDDSGELLAVDVAPSDVDFYNLSFNSSLVSLDSSPANLGGSSFTFVGGSSSDYTSGQISFSMFRSSNGKTATVSSPTIKMQPLGDAPGLSLDQTVFRSSPDAGFTHNFNITPDQPLDSMAIVSMSESSIAMGSLTKNNNTSFSFSITVPDSTPRGSFDFVFDVTKLQGESLQVTKGGEVRGFTSRVIRVFATEYSAEQIGSFVVNTSKLVASVQPVGGNAFSVSFDGTLDGAKQDGASALDPAFGIVGAGQGEVVIDNQVITNASSVNDVDVTIEEVL
jgi:hypothetical protein